jgi:hypothetical protein
MSIKKFHQIGDKKKKKKLTVERGEEYTYRLPPFNFAARTKIKKQRKTKK